MGRLNIFYFSIERIISFLLCFSPCMWVFRTYFSFQESISHPCCLAASGWGRTGARNEEEGPQPWKQVTWVDGCPFTFPLFPDRLLDQKLYLKQELCFSQQILKAIFPGTEVPCSRPASHFSVAAWVARSSPVPGGALPLPHSLLSLQMNQKILWSDRTQKQEAWFLLCACVLCIRNHYFSFDGGHFLPSFTTDLYI